MKVSKHACIRMQQRGIPEAVTDMLIEYGASVRRSGNALEFAFKKKEVIGAIASLKHMIITLQKAINKAALISGDAEVS